MVEKISYLTPLLNFAIQFIPVVFAAFLTYALPWAGHRLVIWIDAHVKNVQTRILLDKAEALAEVFVRKHIQESVDDLKADEAAGKITPAQLLAELAKQKREVVAELHSYMTFDGVKKLAALLGISAEQVNGLFGAIVEAVIHKIASAKTAAGPVMITAVAGDAAATASASVPATPATP